MQIHIEVEKKDPLEGRAVSGQREERFNGWLELLRVLSALLEDAEGPEIASPEDLARLRRGS